MQLLLFCPCKWAVWAVVDACSRVIAYIVVFNILQVRPCKAVCLPNAALNEA